MFLLSAALIVLSTPTTCQAADDEDSPSGIEGTDKTREKEADNTTQRTGRDEKILERIKVVGSSKKISEVPGSAALLEVQSLNKLKLGSEISPARCALFQVST